MMPRRTAKALLTVCFTVAGALVFGPNAPAADAVYPELLATVCTQAPDVQDVADPAALKDKEAIVDEAKRLSLPPDTQRLLVARLSSNAFSVDEAQVWAPFESFDVALRSRSSEAGLLKVKLSEQRFKEYAASIASLPAAQQDAVRRAALIILADTGHLPEVTLDGSRVRFVYREGCVVSDAPGLMTTYMQGRMRELDLGTGTLGPTYFLKPTKATISDPSIAFASDGAAAFRIRTEQIEQVFSEPAARQMLVELYDQMLEIIDSPDRMKAQLTRLIEALEGAYGVNPRVKLVFDTSPRSSEGSAYYFGNDHSYIFYYDRFIQKLDRFVAKEKLDMTVPDDRKRARDYMFGEMVNNAAHELAHAGQHQWMMLAQRTPEAIPAELRARVADYQKNQTYKNTAWESHALIGILGSADYDRYRHQPLEEDAWAIGTYAETRALELVSGTSGAPAVQAKVEVERAPGSDSRVQGVPPVN